VDRGQCTFVQKVRNIERAGGSLAVIIDDTWEDVSKVIMSDDGTGTGIRIPAMLIGKKEGQILKDFLTKQDPEVAAKAALSAEFVFKN
jgi:PA domain